MIAPGAHEASHSPSNEKAPAPAGASSFNGEGEIRTPDEDEPHTGFRDRKEDGASRVFDATCDESPERLGVLLGAPVHPKPVEDARLALVVDRWASLPEALRAGIAAMVEGVKSDD